MDKKSFVKGLFTGLGVALASLIVTGGVIACNQKPVTTTPVVSALEGSRADFRSNVRKAPDYNGAYNYIESGTRLDVYYNPINNSQGAKFESALGGYSVYFRPQDLPTGYYYLAGMAHNEYTAGMWGPSSDLPDILNVNWQQGVPNSAVSFSEGYSMPFNSNSPSYYYIDWAGHSNDLLWFRYPMSLYLVDTLDVPPSSVISLGEDWNPLKAFGDNLSPNGGYLIRDRNWTYGTYTIPSIVLRGLLFKYDGQVYDTIQISLWPLNATHTPYVDSSGNVVNPSDSSGSQEIYALEKVIFAQSWNVVGTMVGTDVPITYSVPVLTASRADSPVAGKYPYNGSVDWVTQARDIYVLDDKGTTGTRFDDRFLGMNDYELMVFLSQYGSIANDVNPDAVGLGKGSYDPFMLITLALQTTTTFMSYSVLPGLTIGMLMIVPLIITLIVVVFKVIKK